MRVDARKLFVGGVCKRSTTPQSFDAFFRAYGDIEDIILMKNRENPDGPHRGFGFVTYVLQEHTDKVLEDMEQGGLNLDG